MRIYYLLPFAVLAACETQDVVAASKLAQFEQFPAPLFEAFEAACTGKAQTFSRPDENTVECREFLPPGATAAAILEFDGHAEDLPQQVIRFQASPYSSGYLVRNEAYLNVPQKTGSALQVQFADPRYDVMLERLYRRTGGTPALVQAPR